MSRLDIAKNLSLSVVLTLLFFLAGVRIPLLGIVFLPLALHPPLALGLQSGPRMGMAVLLLAAAVLYFIGGIDLVLSYSVLIAIMVPLLLSFGRAVAVELRVAAGAVGGVAVSSALLWASFGSLSGLTQAAREVLQQNLAASLAVYSKIGFSERDLEQLGEHIPAIVKLVLGILPALAFTGFATVVLFNLALLAHRFPGQRPRLLSKGDLREWKTAEPAVWLFIASGFLYLMISSEAVKTLALNFFLVSLTLYFFQGLAIVSYYFHHKKVPFFLRGLGYALLVLEQISMLAVAGLGLFDLWMDFRGLNKKDLTPTQVS